MKNRKSYKTYMINVDPEYIDYLRKDFPNVMQHKHEHSATGGRKYIGGVIRKNGLDYFIPISSAHENDFEKTPSGEIKIKPSKIMTIRKTHIDLETGEEKIDANYRVGNMIPIPKCAIIKYDFRKSSVFFRNTYQSIVKFASDNYDLFTKKAKKMYKINTSNNNLAFQLQDIEAKAVEYSFLKLQNQILNGKSILGQTFNNSKNNNKEYKIIKEDLKNKKVVAASLEEIKNNKQFNDLFSFDMTKNMEAGINMNDEIMTVIDNYLGSSFEPDKKIEPVKRAKPSYVKELDKNPIEVE